MIHSLEHKNLAPTRLHSTFPAKSSRASCNKKWIYQKHFSLASAELGNLLKINFVAEWNEKIKLIFLLQQPNNSLECSVLRIIIPNEYNGSIQTKTIPVRPHTTTKDVCRIIAHKSQITNPMDYGLFKLIDGEGKYLIKEFFSCVGGDLLCYCCV